MAGTGQNRQRLHQKLGGSLRAVVSGYYWDGPTGSISMTVDGRSVEVPVVTTRENL
jgi:hypothetical protein